MRWLRSGRELRPWPRFGPEGREALCERWREWRSERRERRAERWAGACERWDDWRYAHRGVPRALAGGAVSLCVALVGTALWRVPSIAPPGPGAGVHLIDAAGVLGPFDALLEEQAQDWRRELGIELRVATWRSARALRAPPTPRRAPPASGVWGAVRVDVDWSARRIEWAVSPDLESALPRERLARLARERLRPHLRSGTLGWALAEALRELKDDLFTRRLADRLEVPAALEEREAFARALEYLSADGAERAGPLRARLARVALPDAGADSRGPDRTPARQPLATVERYLRVLRAARPDSELPLLTEGSRLQRALCGTRLLEMRLEWRAAERSRPLRVRRRGRRAVVDSRSPAPGFVPILLEREAGRWRVDRVAATRSLFRGSGGGLWLADPSTPYAFGLRRIARPASGRSPAGSLEPIPLRGRSLAAEVARLERALAGRSDPHVHFRLAELLFRNAFAPLRALAHYERAARGAPEMQSYLRAAGDRARYLGLHRYSLPFYVALGALADADRADAHYALREYDAAARVYERALEADPRSRRLERRLRLARWQSAARASP